MDNVRKLLAYPLMLLMITATSAFAGQQRHIVNPGQLSATTAERAASQDAKRAAVREALQRPDVRRVAATMGLDMNRLDGAVATMNGADLDQAASLSNQINDQLVGGASTIVISTTTIIIALLIVILIVLIAD